MNRTLPTILVVALSLIGKDWQSTFSVDKKTLGVRGTNPFFNLTRHLSKKWYATGVGPVKDGDMVLVKFGMKP